MARTYRQTIAESLGLPADADDEQLVRAFKRSLHPDQDDDDKTAHADPRQQMTDHAMAEQDKAAASGQSITFTEALGRARKAHPKLDQTLAEGYASSRWTR
jgi:hypothetical protein